MEAIVHKQIITWILEYSCAHDLDELTERLSLQAAPTNQKKEEEKTAAFPFVCR